MTDLFQRPKTSRRGFLALSLRLGGTCLAFASLAAQPAAAAEFPEMTLKFGHEYAESHPLGQAAQKFADILAERSGGKITVQLFPNGTVGAARDLMESLQIGVVDFALIPTTNAASFHPALDLFYLPFLFRDSAHAYAVSDGAVGEKLYAGLKAKTGIVTLGMYESGFRTITTAKTKVEKPDDMKGIKFRVINNPLNVGTFKALGANPTPMALSEVFTALQQGTVDGQDNPVGNVKAFGYDKVQKFITLSNHQWAGIMVLASGKTMDMAGPELRKLIEDGVRETQAWERKEINTVEASYLTEMQQAGMTVTRLTPDQATAFQKAMEPVWSQYRDKIGSDLIQAAVETK